MFRQDQDDQHLSGGFEVQYVKCLVALSKTYQLTPHSSSNLVVIQRSRCLLSGSIRSRSFCSEQRLADRVDMVSLKAVYAILFGIAPQILMDSSSY